MTLPRSIGVALLCKPPRPGATKTRLGTAIGPARAAALSRAFLTDVAANVEAAAARNPLALHARFRPADAQSEIAALLGPRWHIAHADCGDLGATMHQVLGELVAQHGSGIVMGADMPLLDAASVGAAADALRAGGPDTVVIVPAEDGGYCLIGVNDAERTAPLFAPMAWSTGQVLAETLKRAAAGGLAVTALAPQRDIDEMADLDWLRQRLARDPRAAPATRAALAAFG